MSESLTITISGNTTELETRYGPPIELSPEKNYALGLVELWSFNAIPNIDEKNNKFNFNSQEIEIPTGSYEIEDIEKYLIESLKAYDVSFSLKPNNYTLQSEIQCSAEINFEGKNSIGRLLGFTPQKLPANKKHTSNLPVSILRINTLHVECNITDGAYSNNQKVHTIHEFFPAVPPGYKIIEKPSEVIYLPVRVRTIDNLQFRIVDQDGESVNFREETITIRVHIKEIK